MRYLQIAAELHVMQCKRRSNEPMEIPEKIKDLVFQLANDLSIMEIWLIGSRASGNTHAASDWDLLVFSTSEPQATASRVEGIDVLWKGPSGNVLLEGQRTSFNSHSQISIGSL